MIDSRDIGITTHAMQALGTFHHALMESHDHVGRGWGVYEEESRRLLDAAKAAAMFLSDNMRERVEPFLLAYDAIGEPLAESDPARYGQTEATRFLARRMIVSLLGNPGTTS